MLQVLLAIALVWAVLAAGCMLVCMALFSGAEKGKRRCSAAEGPAARESQSSPSAPFAEFNEVA